MPSTSAFPDARRVRKLQQVIKDRRAHWPDRAIGPTVPDGI
jgi:hypothetical protein